MLKRVTASAFKDMIYYGISNLENHCSIVNELNVFPVPDGDTGTNMVMTMKNGFQSAKEADDEHLSMVAENFANATVFGARGNSGVIISQFFKGLSNGFKGIDVADCKDFVNALHIGCKNAYSAVADPTEGTVLTVLREATNDVSMRGEQFDTVDELIYEFIVAAKKSLDNTPNLLPVLQKAGVVDSGGAGIVYFFEGIYKYLKGEPLAKLQNDEVPYYIDYSMFNKNSDFSYGYCTELLIQITVDNFDYQEFINNIKDKGESLVTSFEDYKVKVHIHTLTPEKILEYCHQFGEFLSLKIENMSVQHMQSVSKILCSDNEDGNFSVVAVAPNELMQRMLCDMGADIVILSKEAPSSNDFIEAFKLSKKSEILVFPNCSNSVMSAKQAAELFSSGNIAVVNCKSIAECYSALAMLDYGSHVDKVASEVKDIIDNIYTIALATSTKNVVFGDKRVNKGDYFAIAGEEIFAVGDDLVSVVVKAVEDVLSFKDASVINFFYGKSVTASDIDCIIDKFDAISLGIEFDSVSTEDEIIDITISFE